MVYLDGRLEEDIGLGCFFWEVGLDVEEGVFLRLFLFLLLGSVFFCAPDLYLV